MRSIVEAVFHYAEVQPDRLCLADDTHAVDYQTYRKKICQFATFFQSLEISAGDNVVIEASQRIEYLAIELALQLIGAVFVPLEHNCAEEKIKSFANRAEAVLLVTNRLIHVEGLPSMLFDDVCRKAEVLESFTPKEFPEGDTVCEILFSTGTTGLEKGVVLTHDNDVALAENAIYGVDLKSDNVELIFSPFNHSHGLRRYYANMLKGAAVIMQQSAMDMKRMYTHMEQYHVNAMDIVPSALRVILQLSGDMLGNYNEQLRYVQLGAAPMRKEDREKLKRLLPNVRLFDLYGSTESGITCVYEFNCGEEKVNCIGHPTKNTEIFIVDENRKPIKSSAENPGLLASRGRMNMLGYWKDDVETAKAMADGVVYSNDIAYFDEDGDIILLGRKGDVMNVGGKKVSPLEIENAVNKISGVADSGCIAVKDKNYGEVPWLFVEMLPGAGFDAKIIRDALFTALEPYKVPQCIVQIDRIPRTYKGSLQRAKLREMQRRDTVEKE